MNPLIQNGSTENVKPLSRRLIVDTFDVFVRGSQIYRENGLEESYLSIPQNDYRTF